LVLAYSGVIFIYNDTNLSYNYATSPNWAVGNDLQILGYGHPVLTCTGTGFAFDMHTASFITTNGQNEVVDGLTVHGNSSYTTSVVYNFSGIMRSTLKDLVADDAINTARTLAGFQMTGTGTFSVTATTLYLGELVAISGAWGTTTPPTGYSDPTTYEISVTNGTTTGALKLRNGQGGAAMAGNGTGTPTGLTETVVGGIGFLFSGAIADTIIRPTVSEYDGASGHLPQTGMVFAGYPGAAFGTNYSNDNLILGAELEGEAVGVQLFQGGHSSFVGGTIEAMTDTGFYDGDGNTNNAVIGMDIEANTNSDITSYGYSFEAENSSGTNYFLYSYTPLVLHDRVTTITTGCSTNNILIESTTYTTLTNGCGNPVQLLANTVSGLNGPNSFNTGATGTNSVAGHLLTSAAAPTISSGFGTSPSVSHNNGTLSFSINVGTGGSATSGVIALPSASNAWSCWAADTGATPTGQTEQTATGTATATLTNYSRTTGLAVAWTASEIIQVGCGAN